jgi:hypothetical protein
MPRHRERRTIRRKCEAADILDLFGQRDLLRAIDSA